MANSGVGVRHVRCPRCHSLLQEPSGVPVYQCGGCGTTLRAKNRSGGDTQTAAGSSASPSNTAGLPPPQTQTHQSGRLGSGDVASTSRSSTPTPDARSSEQQQVTGAATTTSRRYESGDLASARRRHGASSDVASTSSGTTTPDVSSASRGRQQGRETGDLAVVVSGGVASSSSTPDVATSGSRQATDTRSRRRESGEIVSASKWVSEPAKEKKTEEHLDQGATNRGASGSSEFRRQRGTGGDAERGSVSPSASATFPEDPAPSPSELQVDSEKRRTGQSVPDSPDAAAKKHSGEAAVRPRSRDREELAPRSSPESKLARDATAAVAGGKVRSPPRHEQQTEAEEALDLAPLRQRILKTVDELRGDLSELFRKSPDLNPANNRTRARPPRLLPKHNQARARHAHAVNSHHHHGSAAAPAERPAHQLTPAPPPPPRGLPSRRYRRCRADNNVQPCQCHHGCCCPHPHHHGSKTKKPECSSCRGHCARPTTPPAAAAAPKDPKRRPPPPRHHCRPVLKGAPFIVCSTCFTLIQVPADLFAVPTRRLRRLRCGSCSAMLSYSYRDPTTKLHDSDETHTHCGGEGNYNYHRAAPFAPFVDDFGPSSYSTTASEDEHAPPLHVSRNTSFGSVHGVSAMGRLHRLMGYGSASDLLLRRSSPDLYESFGGGRATPDYDRKGKGVCVDDGHDLDDSDEEAARGAVWPLTGVPAAGAIKIKS